MAKLTQKRLKEVLAYNPSTGVFRWRESGRGRKADLSAGTLNSHGYLQIRIDRKIHLVHRLVFLYVDGYLPENGVDHKDRNKTNNRRDNLREVSNQCNLRNTGNYCHNTSGVKGVCWEKSRNKWRASIGIDGKSKNLGLYTDFNNAVMARYDAEKRLNWAGCEDSSPAYRYLLENDLFI